jgi:hypothetical protein
MITCLNQRSVNVAFLFLDFKVTGEKIDFPTFSFNKVMLLSRFDQGVSIGVP